MSKSRPRRGLTVCVVGRAHEAAAALPLDAETSNAFLYIVGVNLPEHGAALHAVSYTGAHFRLVFTGASRAKCRALSRAVAADLGGYLAERFGIERRSFALDALVVLRTAERQLRAITEAVVEGGLSPLGEGFGRVVS